MFQKIVFPFILFFSFQAGAQEIVLLQAPGASPEAFAATAKSDKSAVTYMDLQIRRRQMNPRLEEKILALGENMSADPMDLMKPLESLQREAPLTQTSLYFLKDLSEKIQAHPLKAAQATYYRDLFCKSVLLIEEMVPNNCIKVRVDLSVIRRQWPMAQTLLIESRRFSIEDSFPDVSAKSSYHWTLLSNTHKPISFYGTYDQFLQQHLISENVIEGSCHGFSDNLDDFEISSKAVAFFSQNCLRKLEHPENKTSLARWIEDNKTWVYPAGALLLGGAVMAAQGKTLVIDKP